VEQRALVWDLLHKSFVARGARRAGGQFRGASVDWYGLGAVSSNALPCTAQMKVRDGVCRSFVRLTGSDVGGSQRLDSLVKGLMSSYRPDAVVQPCTMITYMVHTYCVCTCFP
jgi:hypothetical protein